MCTSWAVIALVGKSRACREPCSSCFWHSDSSLCDTHVSSLHSALRVPGATGLCHLSDEPSPFAILAAQSMSFQIFLDSLCPANSYLLVSAFEGQFVRHCTAGLSFLCIFLALEYYFGEWADRWTKQNQVGHLPARETGRKRKDRRLQEQATSHYLIKTGLENSTELQGDGSAHSCSPQGECLGLSHSADPDVGILGGPGP